jgi:hypothetical protein
MKYFVSAASALAVCVAAPVLAHAQDGPMTGAYGTLGYMGQNSSGGDLGAIQGRLGYRFDNIFGVEGEVAGGVKNDHVAVAPGVSAKASLDRQYSAYATATAPVSPQLDLIGRLGYGHERVSYSNRGGEFTEASDSVNYGAGVQYNLDRKNGIRADYTRESFRHSGVDDANVWSVAYSRHF